MKIKFHFSNNKNLNNNLPPNGCWGFRNFIDICNHLRNENLLQDRTFWFVNCDLNFPNQNFNANENDIIFFDGDEHYRIPEWFSKFKFIFKQTVKDDFPKNISHFPFLYSNEYFKFPYIEIKKRPIDVFFSGTWHPEHNRAKIIKTLKERLSNKNVNFIFEQKLSGEQYSYLLANSKISLSLDGKWTPECFRFSESIAQGCVTFSSDLSYSKLYDQIPYIKTDWNNLEYTVEQITTLLSRLDLMEKISLESYNFWSKNWTPLEWAKKIYNITK
jgi:hypothetical protein